MSYWCAVMAILLVACGVPKPGMFKNNLKSDKPTNTLRSEHCAELAHDYLDSAEDNEFWDSTLIVGGAIAGGAGTISSAFAGTLDDDDRRKKWSRMGVVGLGLGAALLGLRTALNLEEKARTKRMEAAKSQAAALAIRDGDGRHYQSCVDGAMSVASIRTAVEEAMLARTKDERRSVETELDQAQKAFEDQRVELARLLGFSVEDLTTDQLEELAKHDADSLKSAVQAMGLQPPSDPSILKKGVEAAAKLQHLQTNIKAKKEKLDNLTKEIDEQEKALEELRKPPAR